MTKERIYNSLNSFVVEHFLGRFVFNLDFFLSPRCLLRQHSYIRYNYKLGLSDPTDDWPVIALHYVSVLISNIKYFTLIQNQTPV